MGETVGLVIPAYRPDLDRLVEYVFDIEETIAPETIVIELDGPDSYARARLRTVPAVVESVPYRRGKGAAITAGFEKLDADVMLFVDADGATPVTEITRILEAVTRGQADVAVGSRRHPKAIVDPRPPPVQRILGDGFAWLARRLLDVQLYDYQCGAKVVTADAWETIQEHLYLTGFAWDVELVAVADALGFDVCEIPIEWSDQPDTTVSLIRDPVDLGRGLLTARKRARRLRDSRLPEYLASQEESPRELVEGDN